MNAAHIHIMNAHIPLAGIWFVLLLFIVGLWFRKDVHMVRVGHYLMILCAALAWIPFLSGDNAEEIVEQLPGVTESLIDAHQRFGLPFIICTNGAGLLSLLSLIFAGKQKWIFSNRLALGALALCAASCVLSIYIGASGGRIQHSEIRDQYIQPNMNSHED